MAKWEGSYKEAKAALERCREEILEEFLRVAKEISKDMEMLCETGVDHERYICFEGHETECADYYHIIQSRTSFTDVKKVLDSMQNKDAFQLYKDITAKSVAEVTSCFAQMLELEELDDKHLYVECAISAIN